MADDRFFDFDPLTGAIETFHYDDIEDQFTINRAEDVEPLIEYNKRMASDTPDHWRGELHRVASIPASVVQELRQSGILQDPERLRAWLNESDNRVFRTRPGRV